ncbi:MAG TPA: hypothetical protein PK198_19120, partial [Saprospiraceae bacterium]|nr:hypothetical protein [Saprospiraceae bacterium]
AFTTGAVLISAGRASKASPKSGFRLALHKILDKKQLFICQSLENKFFKNGCNRLVCAYLCGQFLKKNHT